MIFENWQNKRKKWSNFNSAIRVEYSRQLKNGKIKQESRYFITSLSQNAEQLAEYIRGHWSIENQLHWVLDVDFHVTLRPEGLNEIFNI